MPNTTQWTEHSGLKRDKSRPYAIREHAGRKFLCRAGGIMSVAVCYPSRKKSSASFISSSVAVWLMRTDPILLNNVKFICPA